MKQQQELVESRKPIFEIYLHSTVAYWDIMHSEDRQEEEGRKFSGDVKERIE